MVLVFEEITVLVDVRRGMRIGTYFEKLFKII